MKTMIKEWEGEKLYFSDDGWLNATKAAKVFGKEVKRYLALDSTKHYLERLGDRLGSKSNDGFSDITFKSQKGHNGGTYLHPKAAVHFARWCDPDFAIDCDMMIDDILRGETEVVPLTDQATENALALVSEERIKYNKALFGVTINNALYEHAKRHVLTKPGNSDMPQKELEKKAGLMTATMYRQLIYLPKLGAEGCAKIDGLKGSGHRIYEYLGETGIGACFMQANEVLRLLDKGLTYYEVLAIVRSK